MPSLTQMTEPELLKLYSKICADSYRQSIPSNCDNTLPNEWTKLNLVSRVRRLTHRIDYNLMAYQKLNYSKSMFSKLK